MFLDLDEIPTFEVEKLTPEKIKEIKNAFLIEATALDKRLGRKATFQDLIVEKTYKTSTKEVKELFNGYIYAWNLIGRTTEEAKEVYFQQIVEFEQGYTSNESKLAWNDAVIDEASKSFTKLKITKAEDKSQNSKVNTQKDYKKESTKDEPSFLFTLYSGIALSIVSATILNWIFPDDFTWWEKFCGLLFISVAVVKIASSRK